YSQANPLFTAHYSGFVLGQDPSVLGGTLSLSTPASASSSVGGYAISPSGLTSSNYALSYNNGTLTVMPVPLTVTVANASRSYGASNSTFNGSLVGLQNGDTITASYSTVASPTSAVGSYAITPTLNDPSNKLGNYSVS